MPVRITTGIAALLLSLAPAVWAQPLPQAQVTTRDMVVSANPLATAAGVDVLDWGGNAVDAMIAVQTVLGLVEPQSSGIGGGAFVVYYDAESGKTITIDAREKAPAAATENRFEGLGFLSAWQSGLSVGVPGVPAMMEFLHENYGHLRWKRLFDTATGLARDGFKLTERTSSQVAGLLARNKSCSERLFFRDPDALAYFADPVNCVAKPAGTPMRNPAYADTLQLLSRYGALAFYHGWVARDIAAAVQSDLNIPGDMALQDLANYRIVVREPVCIDYRGDNVCGMGPPSSGALAVGQILGILENEDLSGLQPLDARMVHLFSQAGRLAFADRGLYVGDSDFVTVPVAGMLDKTYLAARHALIGANDMGSADAGVPRGDFDPAGPDNAAKNSGTSHVSIVDRWGNALSMTTTVESSFGNGVMVRGFLLNNELTDFSFKAVDSSTDLPIANRVQPNKRPRSSMSPTIVFDGGGKVKLVTGSPGGSRIIAYTAQSIINVLDFGLDPQQAINVPHYMNRNGSTDIEEPIPGVTRDYDAAALEAALENDRGYSVNVRDLTSGLSIIQIDGERLIGGGDRRRDGTVGGNDAPPTHP